MDLRTLKHLARREFDAQVIAQGWRNTRKARRQKQKAERVDRTVGRVYQAYIQDPDITKEQAVSVALVGIPIWMFVVRWLIRQIALWAIEQLIDNAMSGKAVEQQ